MLNPTAEAPLRANKAPARAKQRAPAPTDGEAEQLVRKAAQQISSLLIPITNAWPWDNERVPGVTHINDADGHLVDLTMTPEKWAVDCEGPQPAVPNLLQLALEQLGFAATMLDENPTEHTGEMVALKLLVHHALEAVRELQAAYRGLPATMDDLRAQPSFSSMRPFREPPRPPLRRVDSEPANPITAETETPKAGEIGVRSVIRCCYDIEAIADAVTLMGDEVEHEGDTSTGSLLRCYGTRIRGLNSMVMSHLDEDSITLRDVQYEIYRSAKPLPGGPLA
ncbi:MAG: hypothetical protein ACO1PM_08765 [Acidovorax sp.]